MLKHEGDELTGAAFDVYNYLRIDLSAVLARISVNQCSLCANHCRADVSSQRTGNA